MKKTIFYWLATLVLLLAVYGAASLSYNDYKGTISCPEIGGIPACYLVVLFFVLATISHFIKHKLATKAFYFFIGTPGLLALYASIQELNVSHTCPQTDSGIPMCFISLGLCTTILLFKILSIEKKTS